MLFLKILQWFHLIHEKNLFLNETHFLFIKTTQM